MPTFVDTNILVYPFDSQDPEKQAIAARRVSELIATGEFVVSTQILQELYVTPRRTFEQRLESSRINEIVRETAQRPVVNVDLPMILSMSISFWDALVVEADLVAGATRLLTEDLQHGHVFDGRLRVENPFLP
jgi:predicted nucleic acid-binding protein